MAILELEKVRDTKNLEVFGATVLPQDLQRTLRYLYMHELEAQFRLGNRPTIQVVDGRKSGSITTARRRLQAYFATTGRLAEALALAWDLLVTRTRIKTGAARAGYALYRNEKPVGGRDAIERVAATAKPGEVFSIVGPGVPYGRFLYWNPLGKPRRKRRKVASLKFGRRQATVYAVSTVPLHQQVVTRLRSRYRDLTIYDAWIDLLHGRGVRGDNRWPSVSMMLKANRG